MEDTDKSSFYADGSLGIFTVVALILLLFAWCWLNSYSPFGNPQRINVIFPAVAALNDNAEVYVNGVKVGRVEKIELQNEHRVLVRLRLGLTHLIIRQGATFDILTNGLVGARYVEITLPQSSDSVDSPPIDESMLVLGNEPIRTEITLNTLSKDLDQIDMNRLRHNLDQDRHTFHRMADKLSVLATKAMPVVDRALPLENNISATSISLRNTLHKLNNLVDNPRLSADLKETVEKARQTAELAQASIHELNIMVTDKSLRQDLFDTFSQLNQSTIHIERSIETLQKISGDQELRSDVKQMLGDLRDAMEKLDGIFSNPNLNSDLKATLQHTRGTLSNIDLVMKQLNQILNKRQPLIHMLIGRPGYIKVNETQVEVKNEPK